MIKNDFVYIIEKEDKFYVIRAAKDGVGNPTKKIVNKDIALLNYLLSPCSDMEVKAIANTEYEDEPMIKLLSKYSTCVLPDLEQHNYPSYPSKTRLILQPSVYAGYAYISSELVPPGGTIYDSYSVKLAGYSLGVYLDLIMLHIFKRQGLTIGAQYIKYEKRWGGVPDPTWNWSANASFLYNFFPVINDKHQLSLSLGLGIFHAHNPSYSAISSSFVVPSIIMGASYRYQNVGIRLIREESPFGTSSYSGLSYYF